MKTKTLEVVKENKRRIILVCLLIVFLTGTFVRFYPAVENQKLVRHDSYYHVRIAQLVKDTGTIPAWEPWPFGGRPHVYPPFYHASLAGLSTITGLSVPDVTRLFLPAISSITILAGFWLMRKFRGEFAALITAFFLAVNPYIVSSAYDSPQVIGLFLSIFTLYFFFTNKMLRTGALLGIAFMFDTFSSLMVSIPFVILLTLEKKPRDLAKLAAAPLLINLAWYAFNASRLYCSDSTLGAFFINKATQSLMPQEAFIVSAVVFVSMALFERIRDRMQKFFFIFISVSMAFLLSFVATPFFHPWRQSIYLSFAFAFFMTDVLDELKGLKKTFFTAFSMLVLVLGLAGLIFVLGGITPPLKPNEYKAIEWSAASQPGAVFLASHDECAAMHALTNGTCLLDIAFECLQDKQRFYDSENFFWLERPEQIQASLEKSPATHVIYSPNFWNEKIVEQTTVNRIYTAWSLNERATSVYEKQYKNVLVRVDDVWALQDNSLADQGYTRQNLENTIAILKKHRTPVLLGIVPFFYDQLQNKTLAFGTDASLVAFVKKAAYPVMLHGYNHNCSDSCEFDAIPQEQIMPMLNDGKDYLQQTLGVRVELFAPPKNRANANLESALRQSGLRTIRAELYDPISSWDWENKTVAWRGFGDFEKAYDANKTYVVVIHYNAMNEQRLADLDAFLDYAENK